MFGREKNPGGRRKKRSFGCITDKHKITFRKTKLFLYFIKDLETHWRKSLIAG